MKRERLQKEIHTCPMCRKNAEFYEEISGFHILDNTKKAFVEISQNWFCSPEHQKDYYDGKLRASEDSLALRRRTYYTRALEPKLLNYTLFVNDEEIELIDDIKRYVLSTIMEIELAQLQIPSIAMSDAMNLTFCIGPDETLMMFGNCQVFYDIPWEYEVPFASLKIDGIISIRTSVLGDVLVIQTMDNIIVYRIGKRVVLPYNDVVDISIDHDRGGDIYFLRSDSSVGSITRFELDQYIKRPMRSGTETDLRQILPESGDVLSQTGTLYNSMGETKNVLHIYNMLHDGSYYTAYIDKSHNLFIRDEHVATNVYSFSGAGPKMMFIIKTDGTLHEFSGNEFKKVSLDGRIIEVVVYRKNVIIKKADGTIWGRGDNSYHRISYLPTESFPEFVRIEYLSALIKEEEEEEEEEEELVRRRIGCFNCKSQARLKTSFAKETQYLCSIECLF